jgi:hypothetical protein
MICVNKYSGDSENDELFSETPSYPADDWFERQRAFPFKEIPEEERLKSIEYVKNNMQVSDFNGISTRQTRKLYMLDAQTAVFGNQPTFARAG